MRLIAKVITIAYTIPRNVELITGRPARSAAMPVLFLLWSKNGFFAPQGRHVAPINVKFGMGERGVGGGAAPPPPSPVPNFTFIGAKMWEYSPNTVKISNFGQKFVPQGRIVCNIFTKFSAFVRVYR